MVFNALSVTPQVFMSFSTPEASVESAEELPWELRELRRGHRQLEWRLCNPFRDRRLFRSLLLLLLHIAAMVIVLSGLTCAACLWTSHAATPSEPLPPAVGGEGPPAFCRNALRSDRELKRLLLSIDFPLFLCVATAYCLSASMVPSKRLCQLALSWAVGATVVLAGTLVVALSEPKWIWGTQNSLGFAGAWVAVESTLGTTAVVLSFACGDPEQRILPTKATAAKFGLVLLGSAVALEAMFYFVELLAVSGLHPVVGIICLFSVTLVVLLSIKQSVRQYVRVPALLCTLMLYWFQVGAYMSFRLFIQSEEMTAMMLTTITAAVLETTIRVCVTVTAKIMYNYYIGKKNTVMALRVLDIHIAGVLVDILAEWAAIAMAGVLGAAVDDSTFTGLRAFETAGGFATTVGFQLGVEIIADIASMVSAFTILPISFEGILRAPGHWLWGIAYVVASFIFVLSTLNMRVNIECFPQ